MGCLAIVAYLVATVWVWWRFGVVAGIVAGVVGFVAFNFVGPKIDARFKPRSETFLEFHEAWDSVIGPPMTVDGRSSKQYHLSRWRTESKETGESAYDWLERTTRSQPSGDWERSVPSGDPDLGPTVSGAFYRTHRSRQLADDLGADWPDRGPDDEPAIIAPVIFWDEDDATWAPGTLRANLTGSALGGLPEFHISIEDESGNSVFRAEDAVWVVDRPDLGYHIPAYELRARSLSRDTKENVPARIVVVARGLEIKVIDRYLRSYGRGLGEWIEIEPRNWNLITPSDPPST